MTNDRDDREVLGTYLDEADLTLGQLGTLLHNLQAAIRHAATSIDEPPPPRSIRPGRLVTGTLDIAIEVVNWVPSVTVDVASAVLMVAEDVKEAVSFGAAAINVLGAARYLLDRYKKRRQQSGQVELLIAEDDVPAQIAPATVDPERAALVNEMADRYGCDRHVVENAVQSVEAVHRSGSLIAASGGGTIYSAVANREVRIERR